MKIDMHVHTIYSACSKMKFKDLEKAAVKAGLDGVVITDHNTTEGYDIAKKVIKKIELIPGIELKTDKGEIIVIYPPEGLKKRMDLFEAVDIARSNNSLVTVPHPFDLFRDGLGNYAADIKPDAIEIFNSRAPFPFLNKRAEGYAKEKGILGISGSDAHFPEEIGKTIVEYSGDIRTAMRKKKMEIIKKRYSVPFVHMKTIMRKLGMI
jgi:predicted metal-dependent phosphoesterase TrpH